MKFEQALMLLKQGKKLRRFKYKQYRHIQLLEPNIFTEGNTPCFYVGGDDYTWVWFPTHEDLLADDWEEVKDNE